MLENQMGLMQRCGLGFGFRKIKIPKNTIVSTIPVYNIALNRNSTTRANQDGPEIHVLEAMVEIMI
jgi:hypothetical protein